MTYFINKLFTQWEIENERLWNQTQTLIFRTGIAFVKFITLLTSFVLFLKYRALVKTFKISSEIFRTFVAHQEESWRNERVQFLNENATNRFLRF